MSHTFNPEFLEVDREALECQLGMQAGEGDLSGFETVYSLYYERVKDHIGYRFHDHPPAEDVAQDAFTKAYAAIEAKKFNYQGRRSLYNWLVTIAFNRALDTRRKDMRIRMTPFDFQEAEYMHPVTRDFTDEIAAADVAESMLAPLTSDQAEVVRAIDIDGATYGEYADDANVNLGTVRSRLHRGRKALRENLEQQEFTE